ncbi:hypothetical protein SEVIR_9G395400v4 [Setaria viridis]|uniref:Uncharacterized protein n=1 Tax=Setaria viridis TaxID=4556 RepID=A0A4U6T726_SETVI|nr:hypothetical protein SEVIR_9G395400v2 [Setaria viridis]TKV95931.1 hypothetical protein SEVIR_9G395400v2 [Setaria viridis]TKV95932.1 hypothetical protein SEVIR_9G395400v2 [Setaria viridis]
MPPMVRSLSPDGPPRHPCSPSRCLLGTACPPCRPRASTSVASHCRSPGAAGLGGSPCRAGPLLPCGPKPPQTAGARSYGAASLMLPVPRGCLSASKSTRSSHWPCATPPVFRVKSKSNE